MAAEKKTLYQIIVMGDANSGKTSLIEKYIKNSFDETYKPSTMADYQTVEYPSTTVQLWDTPGNAKDEMIRALPLTFANACVLVFDITNQTSFENLTTWLAEIRKTKSTLPIMLVGTKLDLYTQRVVSNTDAAAFVGQYNLIGYREISVKIDEDFHKTFNAIIKRIGEALSPPSKAASDLWTTDKKPIAPSSPGAKCSVSKPLECRIA